MKEVGEGEVKEIKVMKEERIDSKTERVTRESDDRENVRSKILDKRGSSYESFIGSEKVRKL